MSEAAEQTTQTGATISVAALYRLQAVAQALDLHPKQPTQHHLSGIRVNQQRGRGIDFNEVRLYQPGDEVRHIDWRVTARRGKPHSKVYHEERQRQIIIAVDYSASMFFGTRVAFKSVIAAQTAALLSFAAIAQGDHVSGFIFSGNHTSSFLRQPNQQHIPAFLGALSQQQQPENQHALAQELMFNTLQQHCRAGALLFILSDFASFDTNARAYLTRLNQHSDVCAIFISDPFERALPIPAHYHLRHLQQQVSLNGHQRRLREAYAQRFAEHHANVKQLCAQAGVPMINMSTDDNIPLVLKHYFAGHAYGRS